MDHEHFGRYRLVRPLGEGGMASVHLAEDPVLRRPVALKRLRRELGAQPDWVRRFHGEATAVARLGNPHVVQVFDLGRDHEEDFLVMELVEGISLAALLERAGAPLPADAAAAIACQAASGLAAAHEASVVHRDVKPDNVLIRKDGTVKVADFGIARLTEEISRTMTGTVMGSPLYMAPEQIEGRPPTGALDVFALGSLLFRMLCGRTPFEAEHAHAAMWRIVSEPAPSVASVVPGTDPALVDLVERMLSKDPLQRPSASDVSSTLRRFLSAGGVADPVEFVRSRVLPDDVRRAQPVSASPRLVGGTLPDARPRPEPPGKGPSPRRSRRSLVLWGAAAAGLAAAVLAGFAAFRIAADRAPIASPTVAPNESLPASASERNAPRAASASESRETPSSSTPAPAATREAPGSPSDVAVLARDEAPSERNAFKPRLAFRNDGSSTIRSFRATWTIPARAGGDPQVDAYYAPGCAAAVERAQGGLRLTVTCSGLELRSGQTHPGADGISLGIHRRDWSEWGDKPAIGPGFSKRNDVDVAILQ